MRMVHSVADLRRAREALPHPIGFVPTMGALHAGHESIVARARRECASVIASVFVNPLQFGPTEDLDRYPRTPEADAALLERAGVDLLFAPSREEMYPPELRSGTTNPDPELRSGTTNPELRSGTTGSGFVVTPGSLAKYLEGERRPGFFGGVATVVLKLFNITAPDVAFFGQKDAQQLAVVRRLVADFDLPIVIAACPTVREADGLALSSRNAYLTAGERAEAPRLYKALLRVAATLRGGARDVDAAIAQAEAGLPPLKRDYLAVVDPAVFAPLHEAPPARELLVVGAVFAGKTRLIDNVEVTTP